MPLNHLILEFSTDLSYMPLLSYRLISRKNQAITTSFCFISLSFYYHSSSYHSLLFYVIWLGNVWEKVLVNLFNFYRHFKSTPFHTVIHLHLICISVSSSHCFYGALTCSCLLATLITSLVAPLHFFNHLLNFLLN